MTCKPEQLGVAPASQSPLSHPFGAEPVPVSGEAGIANAEDFLRHLREVNSARLSAWEGDAKADGLFHAVELGGEVGEVLNVAKKLHREAMGWRGSRSSIAELEDEIGDVLICLDKLASFHGIDLAKATARKFNATSAKVGLPHKVTALGHWWRCEHCGAEQSTPSSHCAPPFIVRPHEFNGRHPADILAQVGRNPEGGDATRLRAEHEHAVGNADAPIPPPTNPHPRISHDQ